MSHEICPEVQNAKSQLRLVTQADCTELPKEYSGVKSVPLFNSDNCNGNDFHYTTLERMQQAISFWIQSYDNGWFVRLNIVDLSSNCVVCTIKLCYRDSEDTGVLRLDLRSDHENMENIIEILSLIVKPAYEWIGCSRLITKAKPVAVERIPALAAFGFLPAEAPLVGDDGTEHGDYFELIKS